MLRHICPKIWGIDKLFGFCDLTKVQNYPSIFRINPRYIDYDLVQVYYADTSDIPRLIIHELLHFHYYWTLKKQDPEMMKKYHFDEDPLWILSEVINVVWENTPEMQNIIQKKEEWYPDQEKYIESIREIYEKNKKNIVQFTREGIEYLNLN